MFVIIYKLALTFDKTARRLKCSWPLYCKFIFYCHAKCGSERI